MIFRYVLTQGLFYNIIVIGYLVTIMISLSPRIWGYSDYSNEIKAKVPPQTSQEKMWSVLIGAPWTIFVVGFPIFSTYLLKVKLGGEISYWNLFLNVFVMTFVFNLFDLIVLDWLIISRITPKFVIIPGTEVADYKDFSHHYKAQGIAAVVILVLCFIIAFFVWYF